MNKKDSTNATSRKSHARLRRAGASFLTACAVLAPHVVGAHEANAEAQEGTARPTCTADEALTSSGWYWSSRLGAWYYYNSKGALVHGLCDYQGKKYLLMSPQDAIARGLSGEYSGAAMTGWYLLSPQQNYWMYFAENGAAVTGWQTINGKWYYFNDGGVFAVGYVLVGDNIFYFDPVTTDMYVNRWRAYDNGIPGWEYYGSDGSYQQGWILDEGKWYYLKGGYLYKGWWSVDGKKMYYFDESTGAMYSNQWKREDYTYNGVTTTKWYYLGSDGARVKDQWVLYKGDWYYIDNEDHMAHDTRINYKGKTYTLGSDGKIVKVE
jgi:glucan-binding YG repeat protein